MTARHAMRLVAALAAILLGATAGGAQTSSWSSRADMPEVTVKNAAPRAVKPKTMGTATPQPAVPGKAPAPLRGALDTRSSPGFTRGAAAAAKPAVAATGDDAAYIAFDHGQYLTALSIAQKAAEKGDPQAHTLIGRIYAEGLGVRKDLASAAQWYGKAADLGDAEGALAAGLMFAEGRGVERNYDKAAQLIERAAATGNPAANYNLGMMFLSGKGKPENPYRGAQHLAYAADKGVVAAQYDLATLYQNGHGVPNDAYEASRWLRRAADQGMPEAQYDYAVMLLKGLGVNADMPRAIDYLRSAAEKGIPGAQNRLAWLYAEGVMTGKNLKEAARWRFIAKAQGIEDATLDKAIAPLPAADRTAAQKIADEWLARSVLGGGF